MKRLSLSLVCLLAACGGSGGGSTTTPSPVSTPTPLPSNLTGRSVETDAVVGTSAVSGTEVTLTASGFLTLQTSLSLHTNGVAYLRPSTGEMSASAVAPFVFWNAERSVGWPASTTTMTYVLEASISGDAAAVAAVDSTVAKLNSLGMANVNGQRVTFARASSGGSGGVCSLRVDAADADIVRSNLPGWTRYLLSGGVITSCVTIFRTIEDARILTLVAHEMIHGIGLGHTVPAISGVTLMSPTITTNRSLFDGLDRVIATNLSMAFRRRPNTLLTGSTEDERGASAAGFGLQELGIH